MADRKENAVLVATAPNSPVRSLERLYESHADWLRTLLRGRLRLQPGDADDLVHDTYVRAARSPPDSVAHPKAFLAQIALNLFRDRRRREAVRADHRAAVRRAAPEAVRPDDLSEQEAAYELGRLVADMPELCRDVFVLSRFRHMTNRQIADHLGLSIKTVEWRMSKALNYCMSRLQE